MKTKKEIEIYLECINKSREQGLNYEDIKYVRETLEWVLQKSNLKENN